MTTGPYWVGDVPSSSVSISLTRDGLPATLEDFDSVEVALFDPVGVRVGLDGLSASIAGQSIIVSWPSTTPFSTAGVYALQATLVSGSGYRETVDPVLVVVKEQSTETLWATPAKVKAVTGVTLTQDQIEQAVFLMEAVTGRDFSDSTKYKSRDIRMIGLAVAYQAAYLATNPTVMNLMLNGSASVGDVSVSNPGNGSPTPMLAPMAVLSLGKVSWGGSRTLITRKWDDDKPRLGNVLLESDDPEVGWIPMGPAYQQHRMGKDL